VTGLSASTAYKAYVIVKDAAGNVSSVAEIAVTTTAAPDTTAPEAPVVNPVDSDDTTVTGTAEAGSTVTVKAGSTVVGSGTATGGTFTIAIAAQPAGTVLTVTATDASNNESTATTVTVTEAPDTTAPIVTIVNNDTTIIVGATVTVRSSETGTAYLVPESAAITDKASLEALVTAGTAVKASVTTANHDTPFGTTGLAVGAYKAYAVDATGNVSAASTATITLIAVPKPFKITTESLTQEGGIKATVTVAPNAEAPAHEGKEVVIFQLLKGNQPISIVALEKDIQASESFTAHFNVTGTDYSVKVFVVDAYGNSITDVGNSLADAVTLK
ncbi:Ig-like domain-containing protein, partial [Paenibacillus sp. GYB003]|uniref:Ig-like domain-containing protein n=1 Tax=Paenibacillus sp. GYB003 TaxID=2994392 RepID=UPI002F960B89